MKENNSNDLYAMIAQALNEIKEEKGADFSLDDVNLAELQRRTGVTRAKLRRLKRNGFKDKPHGLTGTTHRVSVLTGFTSVLDDFLRKGVSNSSVCYEHLKELGYTGSQTTVRDYLRKNKDLMPAKRQVALQNGNRGRRYSTGPGESYQMDWGFVNVEAKDSGQSYNVACFAMICHHCGQRYVEFFPNAKQENLFIGMIHAFAYMGVPRHVLTDNMKSVVIRRDFEGKPIWNLEYDAFMKTVGFQTKLCKPRHPFTKGKVERLIKFVKSNFLAGRTFFNVSDLNEAAMLWCEKQNGVYHRSIDMVPNEAHHGECSRVVSQLQESPELMAYICPERKVSFDGFVNYEGRRFGVPFRHSGRTVRVCRKGDAIYILSPDMQTCLTTHDVTWSKKDRFCPDQYFCAQPEEFPTQRITTRIQQLGTPAAEDGAFGRFNFDDEGLWNE